MENVIREMLQKAYDESDLDLLSITDDLLYQLSTTCNPWENVVETISTEFQDNDWIMENCTEIANWIYNH